VIKVRVEVTNDRIKCIATKLGYLTTEQVEQELRAEGEIPGDAYLLRVAAQVFLDRRDSDFAKADLAFESDEG
jgi:hypothetical protein